MVRGIIKFVCNDCGNKFKAPDIEWNATVYSVPQPCPKCGGMHTKPARFFNFLSLLENFTYKRLTKASLNLIRIPTQSLSVHCLVQMYHVLMLSLFGTK